MHAGENLCLTFVWAILDLKGHSRRFSERATKKCKVEWHVTLFNTHFQKLLLIYILSWTFWSQGKWPSRLTGGKKQPSQMNCVSEDLKCWGAWDTPCGRKAKDLSHHRSPGGKRRRKNDIEMTRQGLVWTRQKNENSFKGNMLGIWWETAWRAHIILWASPSALRMPWTEANWALYIYIYIYRLEVFHFHSGLPSPSLPLL